MNVTCPTNSTLSAAVTAVFMFLVGQTLLLQSPIVNAADDSGFEHCLTLHNKTGPGDYSYWVNKCNTHLVYVYWVDAAVSARARGSVGCSRTLLCGGDIAAFGKQSDFDYHGLLHVAACRYPDSPMDDADGIGFRCPTHNANSSASVAPNQTGQSEDAAHCLNDNSENRPNGDGPVNVHNSCNFVVAIRYATQNRDNPCQRWRCTAVIAAGSTKEMENTDSENFWDAACRYPAIPAVTDENDLDTSYKCGDHLYAQQAH
jgi:hypothetical protein